MVFDLLELANETATLDEAMEPFRFILKSTAKRHTYTHAHTREKKVRVKAS